MRRNSLGFALAATLLSVACPSPGAEVLVGVDAAPGDRRPIGSIDHGAYDALLHRFVDGEGLVDYRAWKGDAAAVGALRAYLDSLSAVDPGAPADRASQIAYWTNAYNALTLHGILREYPTRSIKDHVSTFGYNIWRDLKLRVADGRLSLDDIEHKTLRPMGEPRVHFALVCASRGCPRLRSEAYTAGRLDEQLDDNARHFFSRPANFRLDPDGTVHLSAILKWYGVDFGASPAAVLGRIRPWLPADAASALADPRSARIRYLSYDWGLNEQGRAGR